jgi:hypothetical protein
VIRNTPVRGLVVLFGLAFSVAAVRPAWSCPARSAQPGPCCCGTPEEHDDQQDHIEPACCCIRDSGAPAAPSSAPIAQPRPGDVFMTTVAIPVAVIVLPVPARDPIPLPPRPRSLSPPTLVAMHALLLC